MTDHIEPLLAARRSPPKPPCVGLCRGERGVTDSPARKGVFPDGTIIRFCRCCMRALREIRDLAPPPNIRPGFDRTHRRFTCDACGYDHVVIPEIREA